MSKSFPIFTAALFALLGVMAATPPAQAMSAAALAGPGFAVMAQSAAPSLAATSQPKTDLSRLFVMTGARLDAVTPPASDAQRLFASLAPASAQTFTASALALPAGLPEDAFVLAALETGSTQAPAPLAPFLEAPLDAAARPEEPEFALGGDAVQVVSLDELNGYAGGTGITVGVLTNPVLTGVAAGNSVTGVDVTSGGITIESSAFSGYDGIGNFVINSGHNNVLQSTVNVSIVMTPP